MKSIAVSTPSGWRVLASGKPAATLASVETVNLDSETFVDSVARPLSRRCSPSREPSSTSPTERRRTRRGIAVTLDETPLKEALWRVSHTFLNIALMIAAVVTCVLWAALWHMVLRPVRRLTTNIIAFGERPQDVSRIIAPSGRHDEIGRAEKALAAMQESLAHELAQRKRLAELGMAVARINHDLRNMLSRGAAHFRSPGDDPRPAGPAPRAAAGRHARPGDPVLPGDPDLRRGTRAAARAAAVRSERDGAGGRRSRRAPSTARPSTITVDIPPRFEVYADPDHILRVLENLQPQRRAGADGQRRRGRPARRRSALRRSAPMATALIEISDTGPGFPPDQSDRIFEPFHKSTSDVGAGLGLSIAADLVARNGGAIELAPVQGRRLLLRRAVPHHAADARAAPAQDSRARRAAGVSVAPRRDERTPPTAFAPRAARLRQCASSART